MPVLMPVIARNSDVGSKHAQPEDLPTLDAFFGDVIEFGPQVIRARGETMKDAVLAAVDMIWGVGEDPSRLSRQLSGEIDVAPVETVAEPPPDPMVGVHVAQEASQEKAGCVAGSDRRQDGFSQSEEAFFDGYEPEEALGREELLSMFDPAKAWAERQAGRHRATGAKGRRTTRSRFLSLIW